MTCQDGAYDMPGGLGDTSERANDSTAGPNLAHIYYVTGINFYNFQLSKTEQTLPPVTGSKII